jgi:hypothetical protein
MMTMKRVEAFHEVTQQIAYGWNNVLRPTKPGLSTCW